MTSRWRRQWVYGVLLVAIAALGVRVTYVLAVERGDELSGDAFYYHTAANLLADGKGFIDPFRYVYGGEQERIVFDDAPVDESAATAIPPGHEEPTAGHPPVWTVTLSFFSLLGLRSVLSHQLVGAAIGTVGVVLIAFAAREVARGVRADVNDTRAGVADRVGLLAGAIAAVYPFLFVNDGLVMSETMVVVVVAACTIAAVRFWRAPTVVNAVVFGLLGGLAPLTRAELLPYLPVVAGIALLRSALPWRERIQRYALCGVLAVAVIAPWVIRNLRAFDEPVFLSNGFGTVLVQTNCDATYGGQKLGYWELYCGLPQPLGPNGEPLDEAERDVALRERAFDYIADHKARLVAVAIPARVGRMFAVYDPVQTIRFDILTEGRTFKISAVGLGMYYPLLALSVVGIWWQRRRGEPIAPLVTWIALVAVTAVMTFGNNRYRVSAEPALVILGALGIHALVHTTRRSAQPTVNTALTSASVDSA